MLKKLLSFIVMAFLLSACNLNTETQKKSPVPKEVEANGGLSHIVTSSGNSGFYLDETITVELGDGSLAPIIERGIQLPAIHKETFSSYTDGAVAITLKLVAVDPSNTEQRFIGHFSSNQFAPGPRGVPQIRLAFSVDPEGAVSVQDISDKDNQGEDTQLGYVGVTENKK